MNEFKIEYFIVRDDEQYTELSKLEQKDMEQWKKDMEVRALSEYYNQKIKISGSKI